MNPGTEGGGMETVVGDRCAFLANSHVGHDCQRRQQRHLLQQRHAGRPLHGRRLRHPRRRRGRASSSRASARMPSSAACRAWRTISSPTAWRSATAPHLSGLNIIGLQRRGFSREDIHSLRRAYRLLFCRRGHAGGAHRGRGGRSSPRTPDRQGDRRLHPRAAASARCACRTPRRERRRPTASLACTLPRRVLTAMTQASASWRAAAGCR